MTMPAPTWPASPTGPSLSTSGPSPWRRLVLGLRTTAVILFWLALLLICCTVDVGW